MLDRSLMPCVDCKEPLPEGSHSNRRYCPNCNELRKRFNEQQKNKMRSIRHTFRNIREDILKKHHTQAIQDLITQEVDITIKLMKFMDENPNG